MERPFDMPWFAVQVWAGREASSASQLRLRGYDVFLPCYRERRRWSDRIKTIERALFAGYVFCRLPPGQTSAVATLPGVIRVVGDGTAPLPIPADEVDAIQRIVAANLQVEPWECVRVGERVRIAYGPLRGAEGIVLMARNHQRFVISIPLLQRAVAVEMQADWLCAPHPMLRQRLTPGFEAG
jgi:transcription antitermination factor NusG